MASTGTGPVGSGSWTRRSVSWPVIASTDTGSVGTFATCVTIMATVTTSHIKLDARGVAWIDDTNVKVIEVVLDKLAHGSSAEEMHFQYPHLSLNQIYAALSYYHDHQEALDVEIEGQLAEYDRLAEAASDSPARRRLRLAGKLL